MSSAGPTGPDEARPATRRDAPRSLADDLRRRDDASLARLLARRPDLGVPLPGDLTTLGARAATRASVQRALDGLAAPQLQVVEVLAVLGEPVTTGEVSRRWGSPAGEVLDDLRDLALVWGTPRALRLVRAARDVLGAHPAGLGPTLDEALGRRSPARLAELLEDLGLPATGDPDTALARLADHLGTPETLQALLADAPDGARTVLDRLVWGPPVGALPDADRPVRTASATGPVEWLLAHGLLAVADAGHVVLPREVGLALRGGRVHRTTVTAPPPLTGRDRPRATVRGTAAGAAAEAVRLVEALGELWGTVPAPVLRSGGLGVRELKRVATALEVDDATAAIVVEVAYAAGLVADDAEADPHFAPTPAFDGWLAQEVADRWAVLATAWLATTRCPGLVGTRDERDAVRAALSPAVERASAPEVRRLVLASLAQARPDDPDAAAVPDPAAVHARVDHAAPRRAGRMRSVLAERALVEAAWLGVTGAGALADHGRALLGDLPDDGADRGTGEGTGDGAGTGEDPVDRAADLLAAALPEPVDHVLLQADLTAVAPGPLEPSLARELALAADVESRGGATVYRFTAGSVRRALDAGRSGDEVLSMLTKHSRTPVPQPLEYLVADTARRHGRVRVGAAGSYIRCDDESALTEVLADRRAATLRLRRLAPTVVAAQAPPDTVLQVLRSMGLAPAAESPDGALLLARPDARRTPPRTRPRPVNPLPPTPSDAALRSAVAALRAADEAAHERARTTPERERVGEGPPLSAMDPAGVLALLRDAAAQRRPLWIGVTDGVGRASRRLVEPLRVEAGRIEVFDRGTEEVRTVSVHRVFGVAPA